MNTKPFWLTAAEIKKITGLSNEQMRVIRENNPDIWKQVSPKAYRYNVNLIPQILLKKTA